MPAQYSTDYRAPIPRRGKPGRSHECSPSPPLQGMGIYKPPGNSSVRRAARRQAKRSPTVVNLAAQSAGNIEPPTALRLSNESRRRSLAVNGRKRATSVARKRFVRRREKSEENPSSQAPPPIYEFRITHSELRQPPPVAWTSEAQSGGSTFPALCAAKFTTVGLRFACLRALYQFGIRNA
jgi:hypothetical protein